MGEIPVKKDSQECSEDPSGSPVPVQGPRSGPAPPRVPPGGPVFIGHRLVGIHKGNGWNPLPVNSGGHNGCIVTKVRSYLSFYRQPSADTATTRADNSHNRPRY